MHHPFVETKLCQTLSLPFVALPAKSEVEIRRRCGTIDEDDPRRGLGWSNF